MGMVPVLLLLLCLLAADVRSQNPLSSPATSVPSPDPMAGFQPTLAFVIAMLSIMFSITFMLLLYAKLCHRPRRVRRRALQFHDGGFIRSWRRSSGVDKNVIESLPFFRFESLKGAKEGLECSVCLAKYEDVEILRLLPKCKHAFHIECIDSWLEKHSTCPLCRRRVTAEDLLASQSSRSFRFQPCDSDLYVRREENRDWSLRLRVGDLKEAAPLCLAGDPGVGGEGENLHKFNHEIIAAEPSINPRWSSMSSPDLILLSSEMITDVSRARIPATAPVDSGYGKSITDIKEEIERKRVLEQKLSEINHAPPLHRPGSIDTTDKRSLSDITLYPRFLDTTGRRTYTGGGSGRTLWPQIKIPPTAESSTRSSTAEEPNRRVVNV